MDKFVALQSKFPGILGLIEVDASGDVLRVSGVEAEALGNVLPYFRQMAEIIGDSLGFDAFEEGVMNGKTTSSVCVPQGDSTIGIICNHRTKISDIIPHI